MMRDIERYLSDLKEMNLNDKKDLENKRSFYAVSMVIFAILNRAIDIGNEIISGSESISLPGTYKDTFEILAQHKVIGPRLASKMVKLMKYRNIIAHDYYEMDISEVYKLKNDIEEVSEFILAIKNFLKK